MHYPQERDLPSRQHSVADSEEGPGGPPPLIFRPNWGPKGRKKSFLETATPSPPPPIPFLRIWMTGPPPPYLKLSIRHWHYPPFEQLDPVVDVQVCLITYQTKLRWRVTLMFCSFLLSETAPARRRNSLSSLPINDSEGERARSPFPIPSPVPLGHGRSQSSSSLHDKDRGLPNGKCWYEVPRFC